MQTEECQPVVKGITEYLQRQFPTLNYKIEGQLSLFDGRMWLFPVVTDLVANCFDAGAKSVRLEIEEERLTVEDDVVHKDPEVILKKLKSYLPESTKNRAGGGEGIWNTRQTLGRHGGKLKYRSGGGRIIAVATWKK